MQRETKIYQASGLYRIIFDIIGYEKQIGNFISDLTLKIPQNATILDIGCGTGAMGLSLLKKLPNARLLATDIEKRFLNETINNAVNKNINPQRIQTAISDINKPDIINHTQKLNPGSFDIVSIGGTLAYAKNQQTSLKTALNLIKPSGYFIDLELNQKSIGKLLSKFFNYPSMRTKQIESILTTGGFSASTIKLSKKYFPINLSRICVLGQNLDDDN